LWIELAGHLLVILVIRLGELAIGVEGDHELRAIEEVEAVAQPVARGLVLERDGALHVANHFAIVGLDLLATVRVDGAFVDFAEDEELALRLDGAGQSDGVLALDDLVNLESFLDAELAGAVVAEGAGAGLGVAERADQDHGRLIEIAQQRGTAFLRTERTRRGRYDYPRPGKDNQKHGAHETEARRIHREPPPARRHRGDFLPVLWRGQA